MDATPNNSGQIAGFGNLSEGQHAIQLFVTDVSGKETQESVIINVGPPNSAPLCEINSPDNGAAGSDGETVLFSATVSDVDVPSDWLQVTWVSDKDGEIGTSTPTSDGNIVFSYAGLSVNSHTISMQVEDELGATCTQAVEYTVGTPPSISISVPTLGEVFNEGEAIIFSASVGDNEDLANQVALEWSLNGSIISTQSATSSGEASFSDNSLNYGSYNLVVTATDTDGLTDSDQVNFTVNGAPSTPLISINPTPATTLDALTVALDSPSVDPEGNIPTYTYQWLLGGQTQSAYTTSSLPSSATSKGEQWMVIVTPNDGLADGTPAIESITIVNTPPTISTVTITPTGTTYNDDVLMCAAAATDPDETAQISYEWTVAGNVIATSSSLDLSTVVVMPSDVLMCAVTATDSDNATDTQSASITIANRAPTLSSTTISPNSGVTTDTLLTCGTAVSDDDGEILAPNYIWSVGSNNNAGSGPTLQLTPTLASPGDGVVCTVDVADGYGGTDVDVAVVIVENSLPSVSASITPNGTTNTGELTCSGTASDLDDSTQPLVTYEWFNSNGSLGTANPITLEPSMGVSGDTIECIVSATDLSGGTSSDTASHTITNSAPVITSVTLSPDPAIAGTDDLTCTVSGYDNDGDAILYTYEWADSTGIQQTMVEVSDTADVFLTSGLSEDTWSCEVTAFDGTDHSSSVSDVVTVESGCSSLSFDGVDDYMDVGTLPLSTFTIEAWIKPLSDSNQVIVSNLHNNSQNYFHNIEFRLMNDSSVQLTMADGVSSSWPTIQSSDRVRLNQWNHVAVTYDGTANIFVNGRLQPNSLTQTIQYTNVNTWIGARPDNQGVPDFFFDGYIQNVKISDAVKYQSDFTPMIPTVESDTLALWPLANDGIDQSSNGLDGVITGAIFDDTCPEEDIDGDGVASWADCDDNDPLQTVSCPGSSETNPGDTCKTILDDGYSTGDGNYWIDPDGSGAFEVYCDMTTDGGGWIKTAFVGNNLQNFISAGELSGTPFTSGVFKQNPTHATYYAQVPNDGNFTQDVRYTSNGQHIFHMFTYKNYADGGNFTNAQVSAIRSSLTEISSTTRMAATSCDDDNYNPNHEAYLYNESNTEWHITNWTTSNVQAITNHFLVSDLPSTSFILPHSIEIGNYTSSGAWGGGIAFGYETEYILVR